MAFHELATNSCKCGSLSNASGTLSIAWKNEGGKVSILWKESVGPPVQNTKRRGFGTLLVTDVTRSAQQADVSLELPGAGVSWRLDADAAHLLQD